MLIQMPTEVVITCGTIKRDFVSIEINGELLKTGFLSENSLGFLEPVYFFVMKKEDFEKNKERLKDDEASACEEELFKNDDVCIIYDTALNQFSVIRFSENLIIDYRDFNDFPKTGTKKGDDAIQKQENEARKKREEFFKGVHFDCLEQV